MKRLAKLALAAALALGAGGAHAETEPSQVAPVPPPAASPSAAPGGGTGVPSAVAGIAVEVTPLFGVSNQIAPGWTGFLVRIQNSSGNPLRGEIEVESRQYSDRALFRATAPFVVGTGSSVSVRLPTHVSMYGDTNVVARDESGAELGSYRANVSVQQSVFLLDVSEASRLRAAIHEASVSPMFAPWGTSTSYGTGPQIHVGSPRFDPATGDPVMPDRAALYAPVTVTLLRSDLLVKLGAAELDALSGFVLAGGTLAVSLARPEDLRHPSLTAFAGGEISQVSVHSETLKELRLPPAPSGSTKSIAPAESPSEGVGKSLVGFAGGNLHGSKYGASAYYGLGEFHLLSFDPTRKPAVDDPWAQSRVVDMSRQAFDRRSSVVFRQGGPSTAFNQDRVRKELDPNEGSRWAIAAATVLLCIYAIFAGPLNFTFNAKKGKPLRALFWMAILSAVTFFIIVGIGVAAKGLSGRSRHLTLVEAGAGMQKGTARRWRGFFLPRSQELTVRTSDSASVVMTASVSAPAERNDHMVVDRDGARLVDVAALPWQTVVIREDGFASLGEGISILREGEKDIAVTNRSGRDLRGAILVFRGASGARYFAKIKDGERVLASAGADLDASSDGRAWLGRIGMPARAGFLDLHALGANSLGAILDKDAPGLGDAWWAMEESAGTMTNWFPDGVPVLLGQLDGGEGRAADAGLKLERDRLLVRVVGYGGRP
jgi:hypothetical protein